MGTYQYSRDPARTCLTCGASVTGRRYLVVLLDPLCEVYGSPSYLEEERRIAYVCGLCAKADGLFEGRTVLRGPEVLPPPKEEAERKVPR